MLFRSEVLPLLNERLLVHAEEIATPGGALDWSARHEKRGHSDEEATAVWNPKARRDRDTLVRGLCVDSVKPAVSVLRMSGVCLLCYMHHYASACFFVSACRASHTLPQLQALVRLIGDSLPLYRMLLHLLRTLYATTASPAFCTLRLDVLLCLHDHSAVRYSLHTYTTQSRTGAHSSALTRTRHTS